MTKEDIYNELCSITECLENEIHEYKYSPTGDAWIMTNTSAIESLEKLDRMINNLGFKLENDLNSR